MRQIIKASLCVDQEAPGYIQPRVLRQIDKMIFQIALG